MRTIRVMGVDVTLAGNGELVAAGDDPANGVRVAQACPECVLLRAAEGVAQRHLDRLHREQVKEDCARIYQRSQTLARAAAPQGWANGFAALSM